MISTPRQWSIVRNLRYVEFVIDACRRTTCLQEELSEVNLVNLIHRDLRLKRQKTMDPSIAGCHVVLLNFRALVSGDASVICEAEGE